MCHIARHLSIRREWSVRMRTFTASFSRLHARSRDLAVHRKQYVDLRCAVRQMCSGSVVAPQGRHQRDDVCSVQSRRPLRQRHDDLSSQWRPISHPSQVPVSINTAYIQTSQCHVLVQKRSRVQLLIIADLAPVRSTSHTDDSAAAAVIREMLAATMDADNNVCNRIDSGLVLPSYH